MKSVEELVDAYGVACGKFESTREQGVFIKELDDAVKEARAALMAAVAAPVSPLTEQTKGEQHV